MSTNASPALEPQLHLAAFSSQNHNHPHNHDHQNHHHHQQQQHLMRSKSLNDISNDSLVTAFTANKLSNESHFVIGLASQQISPATHNGWLPNQSHSRVYHDHQHLNHQLSATVSLDSKEHNNPVTCMSTNFYSPFTHNHTSDRNGGNNGIGNLLSNNIPTFDNSLNLNNNQCSRPIPTNVFNLCNPLAVNLNDVADQISNLHL